MKIGYSNNPMRRMSELSGTGAAFPFHLLHAWELGDDARMVERLIHDALHLFRVNPEREFFDVLQAYPSLVSDELPDDINSLNACNLLAEQIDSLLTRKGIVWRRVFHNELSDYYFTTHNKIVY